MLRELFRRLKKTVATLARSIRTKVEDVIETVMPEASAVARIQPLIVSQEISDAMHNGKRFRLTSDHAPIFSLFTFFTLRQ